MGRMFSSLHIAVTPAEAGVQGDCSSRALGPAFAGTTENTGGIRIESLRGGRS